MKTILVIIVSIFAGNICLATEPDIPPTSVIVSSSDGYHGFCASSCFEGRDVIRARGTMYGFDDDGLQALWSADYDKYYDLYCISNDGKHLAGLSHLIVSPESDDVCIVFYDQNRIIKSYKICDLFPGFFERDRMLLDAWIKYDCTPCAQPFHNTLRLTTCDDHFYVFDFATGDIVFESAKTGMFWHYAWWIICGFIGGVLFLSLSLIALRVKRRSETCM